MQTVSRTVYILGELVQLCSSSFIHLCALHLKTVAKWVHLCHQFSYPRLVGVLFVCFAIIFWYDALLIWRTTQTKRHSASSRNHSLKMYYLANAALLNYTQHKYVHGLLSQAECGENWMVVKVIKRSPCLNLVEGDGGSMNGSQDPIFNSEHD